MTTKHTPGPWIVDHDDTCLPNHVGITARGAQRHSLLAQVVWKMEDEERSPDKEANARLIAAAPDMLAALIEAERVMAADYTHAPTLKMVRAAIAKATGSAVCPVCEDAACETSDESCGK